MWMHLGMAECGVPILVTVTLISDLVFRIIVFRREESQIGVWMHPGMTKCQVP